MKLAGLERAPAADRLPVTNPRRGSGGPSPPSSYRRFSTGDVGVVLADHSSRALGTWVGGLLVRGSFEF